MREIYTITGIAVRYLLHQVFTDGDTYRDSASVEYDHSQVAVTGGFAYSWQNRSVTIAVQDFSVFEEQLEGLARYGTLTVG